MRKLLPMLLCLLPVMTLAATKETEKAPAAQQQLKQTLQTLEATKHEQAALAQKQAKLHNELEQMQNRAAQIAERLQVSERRVSREEGALTETTHRLTGKQKEFEARKADYAATITALLRMQRVPVTALFAQEENAEALLRSASVLERTNAAVAKKAQALRRDMGDLKNLKSEAAVRRTRMLNETQALDAEQAQLEKAMAERQKLEAQLSVDRARAEAKVASLSRESESLQSLLSKLEAEAKTQAAAKPKPPAKTKAVPEIRGSLKAPVSGNVLHRFGERKPSGDHYRGMVIRTRPSAAVVAPADGEVVFTGPFRDYGNMLLIKHPSGTISLIAGLGKVSAALNQNVIRGEPVAQMPGDKAPEAYVELRDKDAKPVDPGDWFSKVVK